MNTALNYYQILQCGPSASFEELKKSYQKLVKENHPDKLSSSEITATTSEAFLQVDEAWKVLRDPKQRKIYDSSKLQSEIQQNCVIYAETTTNSLLFKDSVAYYQCRCGEHFEIREEDFKDSARGEELLFECSECSNNILITVS